MKKIIEKLLRETERDGIENLISWMNDNGYFTAPCSTHHHLCKEGGLAEHSFNVFMRMTKLCTALLGEEETRNNHAAITICSLLHDIGKCGQFGKPYYVENYLSKVDKEGNPIRSSAKPYVSNSELMNVSHDIRSAIILSKFIQLTEEEQYAILYHNGLYGDLKYQISGKETPLYMLLHFADMWASRVNEVEEKGE